jgi:hypothetical protein
MSPREDKKICGALDASFCTQLANLGRCDLCQVAMTYCIKEMKKNGPDVTVIRDDGLYRIQAEIGIHLYYAEVRGGKANSGRRDL